MSDFAKASDLFGINKFVEIEECFNVTCDFIGKDWSPLPHAYS